MTAQRALLARAPVRISFGGGGTDLPEYYERFGGFVLSTAITRYCHVVAAPSVNGDIAITSADYGACETIVRGARPDLTRPLPLPKAVVERFLDSGLSAAGVDLLLWSDVPPGTGLGSSSAMTVALVHALSAYLGCSMNAEDLADEACRLEIERLCMPIGKQDHYAAAFGGLNTIHFTARGVSVRPLCVPQGTVRRLESRLLLVSTGDSRNSKSVLSEQRRRTQTAPDTIESLHALKALALEMTATLETGDLDRFGALLHQGWELKKSLSGKISSPRIDSLYRAARDAGALGGKITGAGAGGFMLLYCPPATRERVRARMHALGLQELPFRFEPHGASVMPSTAYAPRDGAAFPRTAPAAYPFAGDGRSV